MVEKMKTDLNRLLLVLIRGGNLQPAWYRDSTAEGFAVLARYWHSAGRRTAYHRRGSER